MPHTAEVHDHAYANLVPYSIMLFMYLSPLGCIYVHINYIDFQSSRHTYAWHPYLSFTLSVVQPI